MHLLVLECSGLNAGNYQMIRTQEFPFHSARPKIEAQCGTLDSIFFWMFPFINAFWTYFIIPSNTVSTFKKRTVTWNMHIWAWHVTVEKPE